MQKIKNAMESAKATREGSSYRIVENADGTIDAELIVYVERGEQFREKITGDLEKVLREKRIPNTWTSSGLRFEPHSISSGGKRKIESPFDTHKGNYQVFTRYYRQTPQANATILEIDKQLRRKHYRKPYQAIVRLHWNPYGMKPPRESK